VSRNSSNPAAKVVFSAIIARSAAQDAWGIFLKAPGRAPSIPGKRPGSSCDSGGDHLAEISRVVDKGFYINSTQAIDSPSMELVLHPWLPGAQMEREVIAAYYGLEDRTKLKSILISIQSLIDRRADGLQRDSPSLELVHVLVKDTRVGFAIPDFPHHLPVMLDRASPPSDELADLHGDGRLPVFKVHSS
jgi:hypothetical protein